MGAKRSISVEHLARLRAAAEGLDKLAARGEFVRDADGMLATPIRFISVSDGRRARVSVMDVSVVLELLDEVERLRRELATHADDGASRAGPIPAASLRAWRQYAEGADANPQVLADRLLATIEEIEGRRHGAAVALGGDGRDDR